MSKAALCKLADEGVYQQLGAIRAVRSANRLHNQDCIFAQTLVHLEGSILERTAGAVSLNDI